MPSLSLQLWCGRGVARMGGRAAYMYDGCLGLGQRHLYRTDKAAGTCSSHWLLRRLCLVIVPLPPGTAAEDLSPVTSMLLFQLSYSLLNLASVTTSCCCCHHGLAPTGPC